jgi:hypothetical protein
MLNYRKMMLLCGSLFIISSATGMGAQESVLAAPKSGSDADIAAVSEEVFDAKEAAITAKQEQLDAEKAAFDKQKSAYQRENDQVRNYVRDKIAQLAPLHATYGNIAVERDMENDKNKIIASLRQFSGLSAAEKVKFIEAQKESIDKLYDAIKSQKAYGASDLGKYEKIYALALRRLTVLTAELEGLHEAGLSFNIRKQGDSQKLKLEQVLDGKGQWVKGKELDHKTSKKYKRHIDEFISASTALYLASTYPILVKKVCPKDIIGTLVKEHLPFFDATGFGRYRDQRTGTYQRVARVAVNGTFYDVYPYAAPQEVSASLNADETAFVEKVRRARVDESLKPFLQSENGGVFGAVDVVLSKKKSICVYKAFSFKDSGDVEKVYSFVLTPNAQSKEDEVNDTTELSSQSNDVRAVAAAKESLKIVLSEKAAVSPADVTSEEALKKSKKPIDVRESLQASTSGSDKVEPKKKKRN